MPNEVHVPSFVMSIRELEARVFARQLQYCSLFMMPRTGDMKRELLHLGLFVYLMFPSVFAYWKQSETGSGNGLEARLVSAECSMYIRHYYSGYSKRGGLLLSFLKFHSNILLILFPAEKDLL